MVAVTIADLSTNFIYTNVAEEQLHFKKHAAGRSDVRLYLEYYKVSHFRKMSCFKLSLNCFTSSLGTTAI